MNSSAPAASLDSTPGLFDTQFFVEVRLHGKQDPGAVGDWGGVESPQIRLSSDAEIARS
jgi:hypothetical protein